MHVKEKNYAEGKSPGQGDFANLKSRSAPRLLSSNFSVIFETADKTNLLKSRDDRRTNANRFFHSAILSRISGNVLFDDRRKTAKSRRL